MTHSDIEAHYPQNFRRWTVETSLWMLATTLIDGTTVLPVLVLGLSDSPFLASLLVSIRYAGQGLPQLIAAAWVSGQPYRKPFYFRAVVPGRLLLLWPALMLLLGGQPRALTVAAVLIAYLAFWVSEGFSIVPWVDMVGKTIPPARRGFLFAVMHILGGLLGISAGVLVRHLTGAATDFPRGYGILFALSLAIITISTSALATLREPPSPPHEERYTTRALILDIPNLLRTHRQYRLLIVLQGLLGFALLPAPLYILFASDWLARFAETGPGAQSLGVGTFLAVQTAGMIVGNAVWGHLADRHGSRLALRLLAVTHALVPLTAIGAAWVLPSAPAWAVYVAFLPTFFGFGAVGTGTWLVLTNFLLDISPEHDRPAHIAVANALNLSAVILPMAGGLLLHLLGFHFLFLVSSLFLWVAVLLSARLIEPRRHQPHPQSPRREMGEFDDA